MPAKAHKHTAEDEDLRKQFTLKNGKLYISQEMLGKIIFKDDFLNKNFGLHSSLVVTPQGTLQKVITDEAPVSSIESRDLESLKKITNRTDAIIKGVDTEVNEKKLEGRKVLSSYLFEAKLEEKTLLPASQETILSVIRRVKDIDEAFRKGGKVEEFTDKVEKHEGSVYKTKVLIESLKTLRNNLVTNASKWPQLSENERASAQQADIELSYYPCVMRFLAEPRPDETIFKGIVFNEFHTLGVDVDVVLERKTFKEVTTRDEVLTIILQQAKQSPSAVAECLAVSKEMTSAPKGAKGPTAEQKAFIVESAKFHDNLVKQRDKSKIQIQILKKAFDYQVEKAKVKEPKALESDLINKTIKELHLSMWPTNILSPMRKVYEKSTKRAGSKMKDTNIFSAISEELSNLAIGKLDPSFGNDSREFVLGEITKTKYELSYGDEAVYRNNEKDGLFQRYMEGNKFPITRASWLGRLQIPDKLISEYVTLLRKDFQTWSERAHTPVTIRLQTTTEKSSADIHPWLAKKDKKKKDKKHSSLVRGSNFSNNDLDAIRKIESEFPEKEKDKAKTLKRLVLGISNQGLRGKAFEYVHSRIIVSKMNLEDSDSEDSSEDDG